MSWEDEERRLGDRLIRLYEQAEREIVAHIQRMTASGADPAKTISQLSRQRRQVEGILAQLRKQSASWAEKAVKASYNSGVDAAQEQLAAEGVVLADFGAIHQAAVSVYAEKTYSRLADACSVAGRTTMDIYRAASLEASMLGAVAGYETWQQARRKILEEVTGKGIVGFVDRAGKKWSMRAYAEMLARTSLMEIHNEAQWREFRAHDEDLVVISFHTGTCPRCAPWAGRVLSLTGQTPGYPTLDDAKAGGLFHPRCRHASALYIPDEGETPEETERRMSAHRQEITAREEGRRGERGQRRTTKSGESGTMDSSMGVPKRLDSKNVEIDERKFVAYALDPEHPKGKDKAEVFRTVLGYHQGNYELLLEKIKESLADYPVVPGIEDKYGKRFSVTLRIMGELGREAPVRTAWILGPSEAKPRLTTLWIPEDG